jgi:hypothetical protein
MMKKTGESKTRVKYKGNLYTKHGNKWRSSQYPDEVYSVKKKENGYYAREGYVRDKLKYTIKSGFGSDAGLHKGDSVKGYPVKSGEKITTLVPWKNIDLVGGNVVHARETGFTHPVYYDVWLKIPQGMSWAEFENAEF